MGSRLVRRSPLLLALVLVLPGGIARPGAVAAVDAAPQDSIAALAEDLALTLTLVRDLAAVLGVPAEVIAATTACDGIAERLARCDGEPSCHHALVEVDDAFVRVRPPADDVQSRRVVARVLTELGDVVPRLGAALAEARAGRCGLVAPPGARAARMRLDADRRTARFSPLVALRGGRRYALVVEGLSEETRAALAASAVPHYVDGRSVVPPGSLRGPLEAFLADAPAKIDAAQARDTLERVERDASGLPGLPAFAVLQAVFPKELSASELGALRIAFVDAREPPSRGAVAVFETIDARAGLLEYRARLAGLPCSDGPARAIDPKPLLGIAPPALGELVKGTYRSLDIGGGTGAAAVLGVDAAAAEVVDLPYLLALPRGATPETPLVIAVDGHMGSAVRALRHHSAGILARGLALLTLELPEHGERDTPDGEFADRYDPVPVNRNIRRSATDVMAIVHALLDCGLVLPDGSRYRPSRISYVGYSLGAMVGAVARGVEERLGPMVLIAGAGDFAGWLMLQLIPRLGPDLLSCVGGPEHGASCFPKGTCAAPGRCTVDPSLFWLTEDFRPAYTLLTAGADPLDFAGRRTGPASTAPLLLLTGGNDIILYPLLATRLSDAYDMEPLDAGVRRGPHSTRLHFPERGHEMISAPEIQQVAYDFLASAGRHPPRSLPAPAPAATQGATAGAVG
jgi:hypothetical protein